jgi:C4-dicarboxylate-specific signal transduction histidine kinase
LERVHPEDRSFLQKMVDAAIRDRSGFAFDFRITLPDQSVKYLHGVGHPIVEDCGDVHEFIGTTIDVSERKRNEDALRDAQADLVHVTRMTTMGELVASIAHEVNQPLMAIVTNAQTTLLNLAKDRPNLDEARYAAESVVRNGHRAGDIIRSIRSLVKKSAAETTELDLNSVIGDILDLMRAELRRHDVSLETEFADHEPVMGDRVQLQQVILNLVINGIEAMQAVNHRPRLLRVSTQFDKGGNLLTAVEDSGIGLDPATIDRIFDPLFTTKREGMGMGLSICRSIVEAHGGRLWVSPNLHHGSVFRFSLPAVTNGI